MDAVTALVPPEDLVAVSAMTSQALYYLGGSGLRHKVLSIAEEYGSSSSVVRVEAARERGATFDRLDGQGRRNRGVSPRSATRPPVRSRCS